MESTVFENISLAIQLRKNSVSSPDTNAFRLFNGFLEGYPHLVLDLFASTLLIHDYSPLANLDSLALTKIEQLCRREFPIIDACILKKRFSSEEYLKRGILISGTSPAGQVKENNVSYAISLRRHQDSSFYFDTRFLRAWLKQNMNGKSVLNTFAYCGSLGVAALAGGAKRVVQTDINPDYLQIARQSTLLNNFQIDARDFISGDFFRVVSNIKQQSQLFDCVILDPPFFAETTAGRVDGLTAGERLINKVRPLVGHNGHLIIVNNALYLPGRDFYASLQNLCQSGYMTLEQIIPVPEDTSGYPQTIQSKLPVDPQPFNHSTKIVMLRLIRKDERPANA